MIRNIEVSKLVPHPQNPRKDLGDLTELVDSIKAQGILQNLTVVPYIGEVTGEPIEDLYRVVIGHRRLAAAKLAGLTEVPRNKYMAICDNCGTGQECDSWANVMDFMNEEGWKKRLVDGEFKHYCPECQEGLR